MFLGGSLGERAGNNNGVKSTLLFKVKMKEHRTLYKYWISGTSHPIVQLECSDFNLIEPNIDKLGPGGISTDDLAMFNLDNPDSRSTVESAQALAVHAFNFGRRFNKAGPRAARDTPFGV